MEGPAFNLRLFQTLYCYGWVFEKFKKKKKKRKKKKREEESVYRQRQQSNPLQENGFYLSFACLSLER